MKPVVVLRRIQKVQNGKPFGLFAVKIARLIHLNMMVPFADFRPIYSNSWLQDDGDASDQDFGVCIQIIVQTIITKMIVLQHFIHIESKLPSGDIGSTSIGGVAEKKDSNKLYSTQRDLLQSKIENDNVSFVKIIIVDMVIVVLALVVLQDQNQHILKMVKENDFTKIIILCWYFNMGMRFHINKSFQDH